MRRKRSIRLRPTQAKAKTSQESWEKHTSLPDGYEKRWRRGKTLHVLRITDYKSPTGNRRRRVIVRERMRATVAWQTLLNAIEVEDDDINSEPPWSDCEGWEHELVHFDYERHHEDVRDSAGFFVQDGRYFFITIDPQQMGLPDYDYYHMRGAAKQVARQLAAKAIRSAIRQLRQWYVDGWSYYGVKCCYRHYDASCWRIDDYNYALKEIGPDMAGDVAHQLEADGYVITGRPSIQLRRGRTLESWREEFKRRQNMFNME